MRAENNIGSYCDRCGKYLRPFTSCIFSMRQYYAGENHNKVSSSIKMKTKKLVDFCPECAEVFLDVMEDFKREEQCKTEKL